MNRQPGGPVSAGAVVRVGLEPGCGERRIGMPPEDRLALVTGAASVMGRAVANALAREGGCVVALDHFRTRTSLEPRRL